MTTSARKNENSRWSRSECPPSNGSGSCSPHSAFGCDTRINGWSWKTALGLWLDQRWPTISCTASLKVKRPDPCQATVLGVVAMFAQAALASGLKADVMRAFYSSYSLTSPFRDVGGYL